MEPVVCIVRHASVQILYLRLTERKADIRGVERAGADGGGCRRLVAVGDRAGAPTAVDAVQGHRPAAGRVCAVLDKKLRRGRGDARRDGRQVIDPEVRPVQFTVFDTDNEVPLAGMVIAVGLRDVGIDDIGVVFAARYRRVEHDGVYGGVEPLPVRRIGDAADASRLPDSHGDVIRYVVIRIVHKRHADGVGGIAVLVHEQHAAVLLFDGCERADVQRRDEVRYGAFV